jgi:hypothetical protein
MQYAYAGNIADSTWGQDLGRGLRLQCMRLQSIDQLKGDIRLNPTRDFPAVYLSDPGAASVISVLPTLR